MNKFARSLPRLQAIMKLRCVSNLCCLKQACAAEHRPPRKVKLDVAVDPRPTTLTLAAYPTPRQKRQDNLGADADDSLSKE